MSILEDARFCCECHPPSLQVARSWNDFISFAMTGEDWISQVMESAISRRSKELLLCDISELVCVFPSFRPLVLTKKMAIYLQGILEIGPNYDLPIVILLGDGYPTKGPICRIAFPEEMASNIVAGRSVSADGTIKFAWNPDSDFRLGQLVQAILDVLGASHPFSSEGKEVILDYVKNLEGPWLAPRSERKVGPFGCYDPPAVYSCDSYDEDVLVIEDIGLEKL